MSKTDKSNSPVRGTCSNLINLWPIYPEYLHDAFQQAFSEECLKNGAKRLSEREWKKVLYRLQDDAVVCPKCGEINFASMAENGVLTCLDCHKKANIPYAIEVNGYTVVAGKDKTLTEYHTAFGSRDKVVGDFVESRKTPGVFGIKNASDTTWAVTYPDKPTMNYEVGKAVTLIPDTIIEIGNMKLKVVSAAENKENN